MSSNIIKRLEKAVEDDEKMIENYLQMDSSGYSEDLIRQIALSPEYNTIKMMNRQQKKSFLKSLINRTFMNKEREIKSILDNIQKAINDLYISNGLQPDYIILINNVLDNYKELVFEKINRVFNPEREARLTPLEQLRPPPPPYSPNVSSPPPPYSPPNVPSAPSVGSRAQTPESVYSAFENPVSPVSPDFWMEEEERQKQQGYKKGGKITLLKKSHQKYMKLF
jgi:hypothetical protein